MSTPRPQAGRGSAASSSTSRRGRGASAAGRISSNSSKQPQPPKPPSRQPQQNSWSIRSRDESGLLIYEQQQQQRHDDDQEARSFRRALRFTDNELPALRPGTPDYAFSRKAKRSTLLQSLEQQYGPHFSDSDVRLYRKQRELNAARQRPSRRGGFPLDDSLPKPDTFLKLSMEFQRVVLNERCEALTEVLPDLPLAAAWQLYTIIPGLLTFMTLQVAQRLHGLAYATGLPLQQLLQQLLAFRRLAFVHPVTAESRVGLLARVARLDRRRAVLLMAQQPQLWLMDSRQLGPRAEELALMLCSCTVTALKLIGSCPQLLTAHLPAMQQQLAALCCLMGSADAPASPAVVVPLLLWQPSLLLLDVQEQLGGVMPHSSSWQQQQQQQIQANLNEQQADSNAILAVQQQLQELSSGLQLPGSLVQQSVLGTPDVLQLVTGSGTHAAAAAAEALAGSWLCADGAAKVRQQYQQHLLHLLRPPVPQQQPQVKQGRQQRAKRKQLQQSGRQDQQQMTKYVAAEALGYAAASCQWWSCSSSNFSSQEVQHLPGLQQLVVQAPAVPVLAAMSAAVVQQPVYESAAAAAGDGGALGLRLQSLCQQLLAVLQADEQQQQQQQRGADSLPTSRPSSKQQQQRRLQQSTAVTYVQLLNQLRTAAVLEPCLLSQPPGFVVSQLLQLSKLLALSPGALWQLLLQCPAVLWLTEAQVYERIRVLSGVLKMPAAKLRERLAMPGALQVLLLEASAIRERGQVLLGQQADVQQVTLQLLRQQPQALLPGWKERVMVKL